MSKSTRREILATFGIVATAGCRSLRDRTSELVGDGSESRDEFADSPLRARYVKRVSEAVRLQKGDHKAYSMHFDTETVLIYSVVADENVDVIVFRKPVYEKYKEGTEDQLPYVSELGELDTKVTAKGTAVTAGDPVLVIDNTTWAKAPPRQNIRVEIELDAFVRA